MSPSATPATQSAAAPQATNGAQARHQSQPTITSATPATHTTSMSPSATPATRKVQVDVAKRHACHAKCRGATGDQRRPSAPPEPAQCHKCRACHAKCRGMKCHACHAKCRGATGDQRRPSAPGEPQVPRLPRKCYVHVAKGHACHAKCYVHVDKRHACHEKCRGAMGDQRRPSATRGSPVSYVPRLLRKCYVHVVCERRCVKDGVCDQVVCV